MDMFVIVAMGMMAVLIALMISFALVTVGIYLVIKNYKRSVWIVMAGILLTLAGTYFVLVISTEIKKDFKAMNEVNNSR